MQKTKDLIEVKDGPLSARVLDFYNKDEMEEAKTFRHKIFLEELGWSVLDTTGQEFDEYDKNSVHFGAFAGSRELVGYCRLILNSKSGFMIEKDFSDLVHPSYNIRKKDDTVEISRFAIPKDRRGKGEGFLVIGVLLRCVYQWAKVNKIHYVYGVCASDHLSFVKEYFSSVKQIGPTHDYQPGVSSSAFILDLEKLDISRVQEFWSLVVEKPRS